MKKMTKRVEFLINEIKRLDEQRTPFTKKWTIVVITYDYNTFYRQNKSVSHFFKKLTNGKNTLLGMPNNRDWFKSLQTSGFYKYRLDEDIVEIAMILETKKKINELELKSRIRKITLPKGIIIGEEDLSLFEKMFLNRSYLEVGTEVFGEHKKNIGQPMINEYLKTAGR